jgi:hypothetical protein
MDKTIRVMSIIMFVYMKTYYTNPVVVLVRD